MVLYRIHHPFSALSHPFFLGLTTPKPPSKPRSGCLAAPLRFVGEIPWQCGPKSRRSHWQPRRWRMATLEPESHSWSGKTFEKMGNQKQDEKTRCNTAIFIKFDSDLLVFACRFLKLLDFFQIRQGMNALSFLACQGNLSGNIGNHQGSIPFCKETYQPLNGSLRV